MTEDPQHQEEERYLPESDDASEEDLKAPFTFKLMIALTILYLGWRLVQGIMWVIDQITN